MKYGVFEFAGGPERSAQLGLPRNRPLEWIGGNLPLWVREGFASQKTHGKTPRFGGMLVRDYLYPAAEKAGIIVRQRNGSYVDSIGRVVTRFGFHNLRKAVSDYLNEGKKVDVRTIQDTLRHENPEVTLANYTESSLESRLAAQDVMADAIFSDLKRVQ